MEGLAERMYVFALKYVARSSQRFKPPYLPQFPGKWVAATRWKWSRTLKRRFKFSDPRTPLRNLQNFKEKHRKFSKNAKNTFFSGFFVSWVTEGVSKSENVTTPPVFGVGESEKSILES